MSKRKKSHYIEGWCERRLSEIAQCGYDPDEIKKYLRYDERIDRLHHQGADDTSHPLDVMSYYLSAYWFTKSGKNIYLLDKEAADVIGSTDTDERAWEIAYERMPYRCIFIDIKEESGIHGIFVFQDVAEHALKFLPVVVGDHIIEQSQVIKLRNIAAYIGSVNAEINTTFRPSGNQKVHGKHRSSATWHEVGYHIGAALRSYKRQKSTYNVRTGRTVQPHMRRAHWHHYWTGPKSGPRKLVLKWIAPTLVGIDNAESLSATGHIVEVSA